MCGMDSTILMIHHFNYMKKKRNKSPSKIVTISEETGILYAQKIYKEQSTECCNNTESKAPEY